MVAALLLAVVPRGASGGDFLPVLKNVIDVPPGGDLQAAVDAANPGDTIRLAAGATYSGPIDLPAKPGADFVTIRTDANDADLPPPDRRVQLADLPFLARVEAPYNYVFRAEPGAHHYRFLGLEIAPAPGVFLYNLVILGDGTETGLDELPHDFILERCYLHGDSVAGTRRGIALNGRNITVVDSRLADFKEVGADSQALAGWAGPGPFTIVNNYLEGAGENVMFGGADASIPGLIPADIVVRHNHLDKPLSWRIEDPTYAGTPWSVKNLFELKVGRRVVVEGNVFEHAWVHAQVGVAILFTVRNQDGASPWSQIDHVTFRNNVLRHVGGGFNLLGYDDSGPSEQTNHIAIANNLLSDIDTLWGAWGNFLLMLNGTANVTVDHNTVLTNGHVILADLLPHAGFAFTNNIVPHNEYGVFGSGHAPGNDTLNTYFPNAVFRRNVIPGAPAGAYPTDNFYPANLTDVGFRDPSGGDYRLAESSPYRGAATDGTDVGADIDAVEAATCGVINGTYCRSTEDSPSELRQDGAFELLVLAVSLFTILLVLFAIFLMRKRRDREPP